MTRIAISYVSTGLVFLALDAVWLTVMGRVLYLPALGPMLQQPFNMAPAVLFYLIYVAGIVFFAVEPAAQSGQWSTALLRGAVLGFVAYATYDLTNQATLKGWPVLVTMADLAWGTLVTGASALLGHVLSGVILGWLGR
ncbi:DUF2177 family protein [Aquabacter spiritensis]|uniref:Putative membrane protein n=1 Tax=Aquabacter spiritensis TaxID=933073 RepID=A0A4R3LW04_9HYPH|nr:DUF2177 family protein [Aquabacter spiritensis]TCT04772.1 putative membrane protein [Aquabacter spiritensis]